MPRLLGLCTPLLLLTFAIAVTAVSARPKPSTARDGLIAITVQRCEQLVAIPVGGAGRRNVSRNIACNRAPVWSRTDEVAFVKQQDPRIGIAVMSPDGTSQRFVSNPSGWAGHPRWAPTGRRLLYTDVSGNVHVLDLDTGRDRQLSLSQAPEWSPDGDEIVGTWDARMVVQRADGSGQRTIQTGARPVHTLGWSTSGLIAFAATDGFIWTVRPDGSDERRVTAGFSGTWSPDGTRLAVYRGVNWPAPIAVVRQDGSEIVLAPDGGSIPGWSPDGTKVAFRVGTRLRIADASGGPQTIGPTVGRGDPQEIPTWSPDGRTILIGFERDDTDVLGVEARTAAPRRMLNTATNESWPTFSPDGERVLFSRPSDEGGSLYIARSDGQGQRELATESAVNGGAWSPDGSRIAYVSSNHNLHVTLARVNAGIGTVIAHGVAYGGVSWSPDGSRLVFANAASSSLFVLRPGGLRRRILRARPKARVYWPRWSPRGDRISFSEIENCEGDDCYGPSWISSVAPAGGARKRLTQGGTAGWSPDGRFLAYTRGELTLFDLARGTSKVLSRLASQTPPDWQPTCSVRGTRSNDVLRGTLRADLVCGLRGEDEISGGPGRDKLFGEEGDDRFFAADGSFDVIGCGSGSDAVVADQRDLVGRDCERVHRR